MRYKSLTNKLVVYFVIISLTALGIFAILAYLQSKDAITDRTLDQLTSIKIIKKRQLEQLFNDVGFLANTISRTIIIQDEKYSNLDLQAEINSSSMIEYLKKSKYIENAALVLALPNDTTILEINQLSSKNAICDSSLINVLEKKNFNTTQVFEIAGNNSNAQGYSVYLTSPVFSNKGRVVGAFVVKLNTQVFNEIMLETNPKEGVGLSGETYIVASDGKMRTKSRFINNSIMKLKVQTEGYKKSIMGLSGAGLYKDYRGVDILGSYGKLEIKGLDWHIFAEIDAEEANKPVVKMRNKLTILMLVISSVILFVTYFISKRITEPIVSLTEAAEKIGQGYHPAPVEIVSEDEIALLTVTFNNMNEKLSTQEQELEKERLYRSQAAIDALDEERRRLSRELHDGLGQLMIATKLKLENVDIDDVPASSRKIKEVKDSIDGIIQEIRHISNNLMPAVLSEFGITNALRFLCDELDGIAGVKIYFDTNSTNTLLNPKETLYFFRVAQELIKNAIQHSNGTKIMVSLMCQYNSVKLQVSDNGVGFQTNSSTTGNGLYNIKERAKLIGAILSIESQSGVGTNVALQLDLQKGDKL